MGAINDTMVKILQQSNKIIEEKFEDTLEYNDDEADEAILE